MKPWIFYVILAWQIGPLAPEQQKTLILQFDSLKECQSIAEQVEISDQADAVDLSPQADQLSVL